MPKLRSRWYPRKKPRLQIDILRFIASSGQASQKQIIHEFQCKPSTISEAFKILKKRKLIWEAKNLELKSAIKREKFYKLSPIGLANFIHEIPSPHEFWAMMIWYCHLNPNHVSHNAFDKIYNSYIEKFVGNFPLRSCFFLGMFFNDLFNEWVPTMYTPHGEDIKIETHIYDDTTPTYKVLEYLLLNRRATIEDIVASTRLPEREVKNILNEYSMDTDDESYYIRNYTESKYVSNKSISLVKDLLYHLAIIPTGLGKEGEGEGDKVNNNRYKRYELSLLGLLLMLATISSMHQNKPIFSPLKYYDKIAANYPEKLPLIFGKWELLRSHLRIDWFPSIFDYLFLDKSEILSLSVLLGGNKEIYDNVRSATLTAVSKFSIVYDAGISALDSNFPEEFRNHEHYGLIEDKLDEIGILLRYSSLESFHHYMMKRKSELLDSNLVYVSLIHKDMPAWKVREQMEANNEENSFNFHNELNYIENALAEEFSFLFYIGLLRDNNYTASDYPLTTGSTRPDPNLVYPKWFLEKIVCDDIEIRSKIIEWIKETLKYQKLALDKIYKISVELQNR